jgi:hypothetical protein
MLHPNRTTLYLISLLLVALMTSCGAAGPAPTGVARMATLVPTFTPALSPSPTDTPRPSYTLTPSPLPSATPSPTATATPTLLPPTVTPISLPLTATPTALPTGTATSTDTATAVPSAPALPTPAPQPKPATATPVPGDGFDFDITMQRMLSIDENGGVVGNHNIFVHAYDAEGNPLNGVVICRVYALQLQPPDPHACGITGETGEGRMHFDVYAGDIVYVATMDPEHRPRSPYTRPLEQEPAAMANLQELVDNGYCLSVEDCQARIPINNLVRFHYSYEVHFQRRW